MGRIKPIEEAQFVNMDDSALLNLIGALWENIKNIDERMKEDVYIQKIEEDLKEYKLQKYVDEQKAYKAKLKASRAMAKARGLKFELPRRKGDDEDE